MTAGRATSTRQTVAQNHHNPPAFAYLGYHRGAFPQSEEASQHVLALPVFPQMTEEQQKMVVDQTAQFFGEKS